MRGLNSYLKERNNEKQMGKMDKKKCEFCEKLCIMENLIMGIE